MAGLNDMIAHKKVKKEYNKPTAPLYALVYGTRRISAVVFLLLIGFVLQPIQQAYAAHDIITTEAAIVAPTEEVVTQNPAPEVLPMEVLVASEAVPEVMANEELPSLVDEVESEEVIENISSSTISTEFENPTFESTEDLASSTLESEVVNEVSSTDEGESANLEESDTVTEELQSNSSTSTTEIIDENDSSTSTTETVDQNISVTESVTSSNEEVVLNVEEQIKVENIVMPAYATNENEYTFNKSDCVSVGNGAYHCATNVGVADDKQEQVYSEKGAHGNFEIFMRTSTGIEQITDNYYDDFSPEYDIKSQRLVWQRLIDGRYQIVVYDIREKTEIVVTSGTSNNMEPAISGDNIVWQQWDGNDWEIVLYSKSGFTTITENDVQDIGPVIEDKFIVWTAAGVDAQLAQVYSLETGTIQAITDYEGGAIKNPRFILVYDTKFDNGDIITRGFDPETGLSTSLAATPVPLPIDIPPADSTGETRALIQNKQAGREDFSSLELDDLDTATSGQATTTPEITQPDDLVITVPEEAASSTAFVLTEYDLLITPYESVATSTQE